MSGERERESGALMYAELAVVFGKERFVILMQWADKNLLRGQHQLLQRKRASMKIEYPCVHKALVLPELPPIPPPPRAPLLELYFSWLLS